MLTDEAKVERHACLTPDLERDRVVRRLRAADGARLRAPRPHEPGDPRRALDRLPPAGAARGAREAGQDLRSHLAGPRGGRARARCGRRTSSGSSCPGASIPTARSASASTSSRPTGRARSSASRSSTAGSSSTACPACPRRPSAEGLTPLAYMRKYGAFLIAGERLRHARDAADARRARRCRGRRRHAPGHEGRGVGRRRGGRAVDAAASRRPRASSSSTRKTLDDWKWPEHAVPTYVAEPRALVRDRSRPGRDGCCCPPSGCRR